MPPTQPHHTNPRIPAAKRLHNFYVRFERPISSLSLVAGFVFNVLTLRRVDAFWDNFWIGGHIVVVAACILLFNRLDGKMEEHVNAENKQSVARFWLLNILQFFFGGLLSTYLVFYFRSSVFAVTWPFLLILIIAFLANEHFKRHFARLYFQIGFLFLCVFLFAIYLVPIVAHQIGALIFLVSGGASLIVIAAFVALLRFVTRDRVKEHKWKIIGLIAVVYLVMNILYFTNIIPPLPLSLRDAGVYHNVSRSSDGMYLGLGETESFSERLLEYIGVYQTYHPVAGEGVYAYSAIFSPTDLNISITHVWQRYDAVQKKWNTVATISLFVYGGRDGGYRTYSYISAPVDGKYRVEVRTANGQSVGRISFHVLHAAGPVALETDVKE